MSTEIVVTKAPQSAALGTTTPTEVNVQPEAQEVSVGFPLIQTDELVDTQYQEFLEDRFGRYGY
ncbi:hypothetical protein H6F76_09835 [Leptolyngbya sp. FACHB-321]|uniref:hypothetical protein n=1 Tax=Leptolyngbya sp. FACHB-321 TaxID=2692807 RepID=UPI001689A13A|nr:hypothetical protein [Leptolyngbya sp. FACHB-321]MBD2035323.1 hypothetical protein [Leptolyngbya sp. FACHB-321]